MAFYSKSKINNNRFFTSICVYYIALIIFIISCISVNAMYDETAGVTVFIERDDDNWNTLCQFKVSLGLQNSMTRLYFYKMGINRSDLAKLPTIMYPNNEVLEGMNITPLEVSNEISLISKNDLGMSPLPIQTEKDEDLNMFKLFTGVFDLSISEGTPYSCVDLNSQSNLILSISFCAEYIQYGVDMGYPCNNMHTNRLLNGEKIDNTQHSPRVYMTTISIDLLPFLQRNQNDNTKYPSNKISYIVPSIKDRSIGNYIPPFKYPSENGIYRAYVSHDDIEIIQPQPSIHQFNTMIGVSQAYQGYALKENISGNNSPHNSLTFKYNLAKIRLPSDIDPDEPFNRVDWNQYYSLSLHSKIYDSTLEFIVDYPLSYLIPICSLLSGYDLSSIPQDDRFCDYTQPTKMIAWTNLPCKDGYYGYKHWCSLPRSFGPIDDYPLDEQTSVEGFLPVTLDPKESYCYTRFIDESTGLLGPLDDNICPLWMRYMLSYTIQPSCETLTDNHDGIATVGETLSTATIVSPRILYNGISYPTPINHRLFPAKSSPDRIFRPILDSLMMCSFPVFICDTSRFVSGHNSCAQPTIDDQRLKFLIEIESRINGQIHRLDLTSPQLHHGKVIFLVALDDKTKIQNLDSLYGRLYIQTSSTIGNDNLMFTNGHGQEITSLLSDSSPILSNVVDSLCAYYNQVCNNNSNITQCDNNEDVKYPNSRYLPILPSNMCVCQSLHYDSEPYITQSRYYITNDSDNLCQNTSILPPIVDNTSTTNAPQFRVQYGQNSNGTVLPWDIHKVISVTAKPEKLSSLHVNISYGSLNTSILQCSKYNIQVFPVSSIDLNEDGALSSYTILYNDIYIDYDIDVSLDNAVFTNVMNINLLLKAIDWSRYSIYAIIVRLKCQDIRPNIIFRDYDTYSYPYTASYVIDLTLYHQGLDPEESDDTDEGGTISPCIHDCTLIRGGSYCNPDTQQCECNDLTLTYTPQQQCMPPCPCMNKGVCRYPSYVLGTALDALTYTCQCPTGYQGPLCQIVVVKPYTPQPTCLSSSFNPKICTMGTVLCPLDGSNRPECQCQGHWVNSPHADNTGIYCDLCLSDDDTNPDRCDKVGTHPVSYTRERCSPNKCVCAKGYTGSRCQHYALYADIIFTLDQNNIPPIEVDGKPIDINDYRSIILTYLKNNMLPTFNKPLSHLTLVELKEYIEIYNISRHYDTITNSIIQYDLTLVMNPTNISQLAETQPYIITDLLSSSPSSSIHTIQQISIADIISDISSQWNDITDGLSSIGDGNLGTPTSHPPYDSSICLPGNTNNTTTPPPDTTTCPAPPEFRDAAYDEEYKGSLDLDFLASPPDRGSTASKVGSVVGIIVGCCIAFIILLIVIIWSKKAKKLCFKPREKKKSNSKTKTIKSCEISSSGGTQMAVLSETKSDAPLVSPGSTYTGTNHGPSSTIPTPVPGNDGEKLPHGWNKVRDPATGKKYYLNDLTLETSWDAPNPDGTKATSGSDLGW